MTSPVTRPSLSVVIAVAAPPLIATLVVAWFSIAELSGRTLLAYERPLNVAEAAGMGRGSDVLRLIEAGQDPRAVMPVRPEVISSSVTEATTLEAAVWSRRLHLITLLDNRGAIEPGQRHRLACLAVDIKAPAMAAYLDPAAPAGCRPGAVLEEIQRRSR
jgi:hypothetical protein